MKALAFALVLSLSLLGAEHARAADLPLPGGAPIPPSSYYPVSPPINWGGVYIGLNGGYGLGQSNWSDHDQLSGWYLLQCRQCRASKSHQDHPERLSVFHRKLDPRWRQLQVQLVILQAHSRREGCELVLYSRTSATPSEPITPCVMMTPTSVAQYLEPETPPTSRRERCFRPPAQVQVRKWPKA